MHLLWLSLAALTIGPALHTRIAGRDSLRAGLDGFVFVAVGGLVLLHILPETIAIAGWGAVVAGLVGLFGPLLFEGTLTRGARQAHAAAYGLALAGLVIHGLVDGVALTGELSHHHHQHHADALALGVVLHRIPVGLTAWWLIRPRYGWKPAAGLLGIIAASTVVGWFSAGALGGMLASHGSGLFQALVAGSLLHVIGHRTHIEPVEPGGWHLSGGIGALVGIALIMTVNESDPHADAHAHAAFSDTVLTLALESAPALLVAYLMAGMIQVFLPKASIDWMRRGRPLSQAARGVGFGLPLPICSCGVVPVYRSLVVQGVPPAAGLAFLIATPELGIDAVLLSLPLLGAKMTAVRVAGAAIVAIVVGWATARVLKPKSTLTREAPEEAAPARPLGARLVEALKVGTFEVFDSTGPWILLGITVAALIHGRLDPGWIDALPAGLEVPLFAVIGMPMYVCASGATPLVAMLILSGVSPGAALAFLLTGPATNVTTFGLLSRVHDRRVALFFAAAVIVTTVSLGWAVDAVVPSVEVLDVGHEHGEPSWIAKSALGGLLVLLLLSILRQGPRGFVGQIFSWTRHGEDDACHDTHDPGDAGDAGDAGEGHAEPNDHACCH